ncbi:MAG: type II secretion system protein GspE, partial [Candidatus Falkowbacteria bacterium]|nr:type II secretion system protein GspE [Candidatus Falkowbacteria bacterium]
SGRIAIAESILINDTLKEMINSGDKNLNLTAIKKSQDFMAIKQDGFFKVLQGVTTMAEVLRVIES